MCFSCSTEKEANLANRVCEENYTKYLEYSNKPVCSVLDYINGKNDITRSNESVLGFTDKDVAYISSLDEEGLRDLQAEVLEKSGFKTEEEIELQSEQAYNKICEEMSAEELMKFNSFIDNYIEMPAGVESLKQLGVLQPNSYSDAYNNACIYSAINIDNFGRKLYQSLKRTRVSVRECKEYFATRMVIVSVGAFVGMLLPGPGIAVVANAVFETAGVTADYLRCMKYAK